MYIAPNGSQKVTLTAGEYMTVSSIGAGQTKVMISSKPNIAPETFYELDRIENEAQTYGTFTADKTFIIESGGATVEVITGAMNVISMKPAIQYGAFTALPMTVPASTFVTLSIADNAGSAQISSAGIHSLTSGAAVNKYVYITWSGGTATSGFYKVTSVDSTTAITINLAYDAGLGTPVLKCAGQAITVYTDVIKANTMKIGSVLQYEGLFTSTASANNKNLTLTYGGVTLLNYTYASSYASVLTQKRVCQCSGTEILTNGTGVTGFGPGTSASVRGSVDPTADNSLILQVTIATANEFLTVEAYRAQIEY